MRALKNLLIPILLFISASLLSVYSYQNLSEFGSRTTASVEDVTEKPFHLYLSVSNRHIILHYTGNNKTGKLSLTDSARVSGSCGSLAVSPDKRFLYAAVRSENSIATFSIKRKGGSLHFISSIKAAGNPVYLSCDKTGKFLLSAYYSDNRIAVYQIQGNGKVRPGAIQVIDIPTKPHYIRIDKSNKYVFVPVLGADMIRQYIFDPEQGPLTPNDPPQIITAKGSGPRHLAFHPDIPYCYGVNELNSTISAYSLDENTGLLNIIQTVSNVPAGYRINNTCADVHVTPNGKYLYSSNRGHNSLAAYKIDQNNGRLKIIGYYPTEKTPREFDIDPSGKFVYAAGQDSGGLASYRINSSGELEALAVYHPGGSLTWVEIIELNDGR